MLNFPKNKCFGTLLVTIILSGIITVFTQSITAGRFFSIFFIIVLSLLLLPTAHIKNIHTRSGKTGGWVDVLALILVTLIAVLGLFHYIHQKRLDRVKIEL